MQLAQSLGAFPAFSRSLQHRRTVPCILEGALGLYALYLPSQHKDPASAAGAKKCACQPPFLCLPLGGRLQVLSLRVGPDRAKQANDGIAGIKADSGGGGPPPISGDPSTWGNILALFPLSQTRRRSFCPPRLSSRGKKGGS